MGTVLALASVLVVSVPLAVDGVHYARTPSFASPASPKAATGPATVSAPAEGHLERLATVPLPSHGGARTPSYLDWGEASWLAYDPVDRLFFVSDSSGAVDVLPDALTPFQEVVATVSVGSDPFGVAYDARSGDVYVANYGSGNVTVFHASSLAVRASIRVGANPMGIAADPGTGLVYVANYNSSSISVINDSSFAVEATIPVGTNPLGVAVDEATGQVVVANHGSSNISILSAATGKVTANLAAPSGPYGVTIDTWSDVAYVTDEQASEISAIDLAGPRVTTNYSMPYSVYTVDLQGLAFDSLDERVYVGAGDISLAVLDPVSGSVDLASYDPSGVAVDSTTGAICVTNAANRSFECGEFYFGPPAGGYRVTFSEHGLTSGAYWSVRLDGGWNDSLAPATIGYTVRNGTYPYTVWTGGARTETPSPHGGLVTVNGADVNVSVTVRANSTFPVNFGETGLPTGTQWTVWVNDAVSPDWGGNSSSGASTGTSSTTSLGLINGTYQFGVVAVPGYRLSPFVGEFTLAGYTRWINVSFSPHPPPTYTVTFTEAGLAPGNGWWANLNGLQNESHGTSVSFNVTNGSYPFEVWAVGYAPNVSSGTVNVNGAPTGVAVTFVGTSVYRLSFQETGLPAGTGWAVLIGNQSQSSLSPVISFAEPNGSYGYVIVLVSGFVATGSGTAVVNGSNTTIPVAFHPQLYPIVFVEFGLPSGSNWSVTVVNLTLGINRTQSTTGNSITFFLPNGTYTAYYTLPAGYTGNVSSTTFTVSGKAATGGTISTTGPPAGGNGNRTPPAATTPATGEVPAWVLGAALAGFVVVLFVVLMAARRPRSPD